MNLGLSVAFVLLALTGTVKGSHLSDGSIDPRLEAAVHRARRWSGGLNLFDRLRGSGELSAHSLSSSSSYM